jgi:hypothetical protein
MLHVTQRSTVVGSFETLEQALRAAGELRLVGFREEQFGVVARRDAVAGQEVRPAHGYVVDWEDDSAFEAACQECDPTPPEAIDAVRAGRVLVAVRADDRYSEVLAILQRHGAEDIERVESVTEYPDSEMFLG